MGSEMCIRDRWRNRVEGMAISFERQIELILSLEDRDLKNQERLIKILGLETLKIEQSNALDFNVIRERALELEKKDRLMEMYPELTGVVK